MPGQPLKNYIYLKATSIINYGCAVLDDILKDFVNIVDDINMQALF